MYIRMIEGFKVMIHLYRYAIIFNFLFACQQSQIVKMNNLSDIEQIDKTIITYINRH